MAEAVPVARVPEQATAPGSNGAAAARDRGGIGEPAQRGLQQRRELPQPQVVLAPAQQPWEQVPDQPVRSAQPVPLAVEAQQDLRDGDAGELSIGDGRSAARPAAGESARCGVLSMGKLRRSAGLQVRGRGGVPAVSGAAGWRACAVKSA